MAILGAFEDGPATRSLTEIAQVADLPMPTAHRLVGELVEWGALRRDEAGRYRVGRRVWRIGQNAGRELRDSARRHLTDLLTTTGETCHLAIRDSDQALVIDRLYGSGQGHGGEPGDRLDLRTTATGQVLLAFEAALVREGYLAGLPAVERARLAEVLSAVRGRGWAAVVEEGRPGCVVAVPVLLDEDQAAAAIGLVSPTMRRQQVDRYVAALRQTARRMEPEARRWPNRRAVVAAFGDDFR